MNNTYKEISASIVIYNTPFAEIELLLKGLHALDICTYVIDNSANNAIETKINAFENIEYINTKKNVGYGSAHNIGLLKSRENNFKYHIVVNPDIEIQYKSIAQLYQFMELNIDTGLCMPTIVYPDGEMQYLCKLLPSPADLIFRRFLPLKSLQKSITKRFELHSANYTKSFNVPSLSGCFMFLRNDTLKKVGLFDENIFMYCEDLDLCRRIGRVSKTQYVPTEAIVHRYNKESYRSLKLLLFHIKSAVYFFNKWGWIFDSERKQINANTLKAIDEMHNSKG